MNHWVRPLPSRAISADEILGRLNSLRDCDLYQDECCDRGFTAHMTYCEWLDVVGWDEICSMEDLVYAFGTEFNDNWPPLALTEHTTLGQVCDWVAANAQWEYVAPLRIAGTESYEAGVFLAILSLMERVGVNTSGIKPSDALMPWLIEHSRRFVPELRKLFLLDLPTTSFVRHPLTRAGRAMCVWEFISLIVAGLAAGIAQAFGLLVTSVVGIAFAVVSIQIGERLLPSHYQFGEVITFRDLARSIAASQARSGDRRVVAV